MAEEKKKPVAKKPEVKKEPPVLDLNELNKLHRDGVAKRKEEAEKS